MIAGIALRGELLVIVAMKAAVAAPNPTGPSAIDIADDIVVYTPKLAVIPNPDVRAPSAELAAKYVPNPA